MKNFYSFVGNGDFSIGCTGSTVYLFDKKGSEIAKFRELTYAYDCAISPKGDVFAVKTTEGRLAVYSLSEAKLLKKFRFSEVEESQDDNFCFSADGEELYNIERHVDSCKTALCVYETKDYTLKKKLFSDDFGKVLTCVEYDAPTETVFLTGYFRKKRSGVAFNHFVARLDGEILSDIRYISAEEAEYYVSYKKLEMGGFTEKSKRLSVFDGKEDQLMKARSEGLSLAQLWKEKENNRDPERKNGFGRFIFTRR